LRLAGDFGVGEGPHGSDGRWRRAPRL
jgi:hypothetical protein